MPSFKRKNYFGKVYQSEWWPFNKYCTFALALIPATVVGAYVGVGGATALGRERWERLLSIGGRYCLPIEAGMERRMLMKRQLKVARHTKSRGAWLESVYR